MLQAFRGPGLHFLPEDWARAGHMIKLLDESKRPGNSASSCGGLLSLRTLPRGGSAALGCITPPSAWL